MRARICPQICEPIYYTGFFKSVKYFSRYFFGFFPHSAVLQVILQGLALFQTPQQQHAQAVAGHDLAGTHGQGVEGVGGPEGGGGTGLLMASTGGSGASHFFLQRAVSSAASSVAVEPTTMSSTP